MRIPSGVTDQYIFFVAVDSTDLKTRETGLTTFTVYRSRNGAAAAAMTTPTVAELSAANMPGVYSLLLDEDMTIAAGNDSEEMLFHITQASMAPVTRTIELYRPKITAGNTLGVAADGDVSGNLDGTVATVTTLTGHTAQTGDNYARIGATGAGLTSLAQASLVTSARMGALTDWINGGRLDLLLDAIPTTAMRGTDNAALASVATETRLAELDAANLPADVAAIPTTAMRGTDNAALASVATDARLAELDAANLPADIAAIPTTAMRGTDNAATEAKQDIIDANIDQIETAVITNAAGTDIAADIIAMKAETALIVADTSELQTDWTNAGRLDAILDAVLAMLDDTRAEPGQGAPAVNPDAMTKLDYLYKAWRNKTETTATTHSIYNDAGTTVDQKATVSDDGTTYAKAEVATGP